MKRETFIAKKEKELIRYGERMRKTYKRFGRYVRVQAERNNRKGRAEAAGECVLQALDALCETAAQKPLVAGGTVWHITEEKLKDDNGESVVVYEVGFSALSSVREYTDEQIKAEMDDTWKKMMREVDERFPEEKDEQN